MRARSTCFSTLLVAALGLLFCCPPTSAQDCAPAYRDAQFAKSLGNIDILDHPASGLFARAREMGCGLAFIEGINGMDYTGVVGNPRTIQISPPAPPPPLSAAELARQRNNAYLQMNGKCTSYCNAVETTRPGYTPSPYDRVPTPPATSAQLEFKKNECLSARDNYVRLSGDTNLCSNICGSCR